MLASLRHDRFVSGYHHQHRVDSANAREHVLHETLVAGYIDEADMEFADTGVGEAQINGDSAFLLLLEPVGIDSRQSAYQGALAVIDVAGGTDDSVAVDGV